MLLILHKDAQVKPWPTTHLNLADGSGNCDMGCFYSLWLILQAVATGAGRSLLAHRRRGEFKDSYTGVKLV